MRRLLRLILGLVASALLAVTASAQEAPDPGQRIDLWEGGVPGHEDRASIPEESRDYWTKSINNPSLRYFAASPDRRTGAAVIIMPGGGHELLVTTTEGSDVARWFAERGVDAFVLSYRLFRQEGSPWTITDARQDGERAVRLLRSRAEEFHIDPERIGVMGFSAGGELAGRAAGTGRCDRPAVVATRFRHPRVSRPPQSRKRDDHGGLASAVTVRSQRRRMLCAACRRYLRCLPHCRRLGGDAHVCGGRARVQHGRGDALRLAAALARPDHRLDDRPRAAAAGRRGGRALIEDRQIERFRRTEPDHVMRVVGQIVSA